MGKTTVKPYENTLENMIIALESSPLANMETEMSERIDKETQDKRQTLLSIISKEDNLEADELLGDIEYSNRVEAYKCGFRRAVHIVLDTFMTGGEISE